MPQPTDDLTLPDFTDTPWQLLPEDTGHLDLDRNNAVVVESSFSLGYSGTGQLPWMPSVDNLQVISDPFMNTFLSYPNVINPLPFWTRSEMGGEFNIPTALQPFDQRQVVTSWPSTVGTTIPSFENVWLPFSSNNQVDLAMPTLPWSAPEKDGNNQVDLTMPTLPWSAPEKDGNNQVDLTMPTLPWSAPEKDGNNQVDLTMSTLPWSAPEKDGHRSHKLVDQWNQVSPPDQFVSIERSKGQPWKSINTIFAEKWGRVGDKTLSMRLSRLKKQNSFVRELLLHGSSDLPITFYYGDASQETLGGSHK